jgi:simple sugar transport system ATP-binding protein
MAKTTGPVVRLERVTRRFGELTAVSEATAELLPGEIHAIVGENGAGKSTLMKMAAGVLAPSDGKVLVDGTPLSPPTAAEAIRRSIGMVHQHFMLVGAFRAVENLVLGSEPVGAGGRLDLGSALERARALMKSSGLDVPLESLTDALTVGQRQRLEILRVLYRGARAILLDEPTAVLSPIEAEELYGTLRRLADEGRTIAVVTHRLDEVVRFADRVTVMRRGRVVLLGPAPAPAEGPAEAPRSSGAKAQDELTRAIMGGEPPPAFQPPALARDAAKVLEIEKLVLEDEAGRRVLDGLDLSARSGEIVGIAGVEGNGQRELVRALAGLEPRTAGRVAVAGRDVSWQTTPAARRNALGIVHEDRHVDGLVLEASVGDNLVLGDLGVPGLDEAATVTRRIAEFQVVPPEPTRLAAELSGGNQQKLIMARTLDRVRAGGARAVLVCAQPTRGVDVGAAAGIHRAIGEAAKAGLAVVVVSADLAELRKLSHRISVIRRGRIVTTLPPDADEQRIGRAMLGVDEEAA